VSENLSRHLQEHPEENLADVAFTLQSGRRALAHRRVVIAEDSSAAVAALGGETAEAAEVFTDQVEEEGRPVIFLFPGQGSQHASMGLQLAAEEPVFGQHLERCAELLQPHLGEDLREILGASDVAERLRQTALTQPALFALEYSLAQQWMAWGVRPAAMIGHSIGEYVAATLAGVFSLSDALALVALRGRLLQEQPVGSMLSLSLGREAVLERLAVYGGEGLALAAVNGPERAVVAGSEAEIEAFEATLEGIPSRRLHTSHAFHSPLMEGAVAPFVEALSAVQMNPPQLPFYSNVSGSLIEAGEATDAAYWARHLRQPVLFSDALEKAKKVSDPVFLEVGPGQGLSSLCKGHPAIEGRGVVSCLGTA
jgi:acyl transferase domain-containing protein